MGRSRLNFSPKLEPIHRTRLVVELFNFKAQHVDTFHKVAHFQN